VALGQFEEPWAVSGRAESARQRWYHKVGAVLYVFFCFEIGAILILSPWLDVWDRNYFSGFGPTWFDLWMSPFFRGAVSGLGLVNIVISFVELFRLRRFAHRKPEAEP
jgi:hypothetical protein